MTTSLNDNRRVQPHIQTLEIDVQTVRRLRRSGRTELELILVVVHNAWPGDWCHLTHPARKSVRLHPLSVIPEIDTMDSEQQSKENSIEAQASPDQSPSTLVRNPFRLRFC